MPLHQGAEEGMDVRYIIWSFGIPATKPCNLVGDNIGIIQNAVNQTAEIKKETYYNFISHNLWGYYVRNDYALLI